MLSNKVSVVGCLDGICQPFHLYISWFGLASVEHRATLSLASLAASVDNFGSFELEDYRRKKINHASINRIFFNALVKKQSEIVASKGVFVSQ